MQPLYIEEMVGKSDRNENKQMWARVGLAESVESGALLALYDISLFYQIALSTVM